jgi:hypothetical protein
VVPVVTPGPPGLPDVLEVADVGLVVGVVLLPDVDVVLLLEVGEVLVVGLLLVGLLDVGLDVVGLGEVVLGEVGLDVVGLDEVVPEVVDVVGVAVGVVVQSGRSPSNG